MERMRAVPGAAQGDHATGRGDARTDCFGVIRGCLQVENRLLTRAAQKEVLGLQMIREPRP